MGKPEYPGGKKHIMSRTQRKPYDINLDGGFIKAQENKTTNKREGERERTTLHTRTYSYTHRRARAHTRTIAVLW